MNDLVNYTLHHADTTLILAQRNSEWCAHGPILEQDIAITNISLDLIGQSRNFYQYSAQLINENAESSSLSKSISTSSESGGEVYTLPISKSDITLATEDSLAYLRTEREYKNLLICELPNIDWAHTILRQYLFSVYQYLLYEKLSTGKDAQLAAIAVKSIKEVTYHIKWSRDWLIRLGDGTEESHLRMKNAINYLWMYTGEIFQPAVYESAVSVDLLILKEKWTEEIKSVFHEAGLIIPEKVFMQSGGKEGKHTEHLGFLLSDLQYLQRTYPDAEW
jgi:ring-1,2-phenylacetyl-CoA epoxidase subunit PaaC